MDRKANSYPVLDDVKAVFFDCWGTLLHEKEDRRVYLKQIYDHCVNKEEIPWERAYEKASQFWDDYQRTTHNDVRIDAFVNLFCLMYDVRLDSKVEVVSSKIIDDIAGEPMDGIEDFLHELNRRHIYHGVISNTVFDGEETAKIIQQKIPDNGFETFFFSNDYALRKPYPLIYKAALKQAGKKKEASIFIGDSFLDDVVGSFRFGFSKSIFLSHRPSQELLAEKDEYRDVKYIRIHSYRDLIRL